MRLDQAPLDQAATVTGTDLSASTTRQLAAMGLALGSRIVRAQRISRGGSVIAVGGDRIALDGHTCRLIEVETA